MRNHGLRIFLKIIRRQETVIGGYEFFEKSPGAARDCP